MMICMEHLDEQALGHVAEYFRVLGEPVRLRILNALRAGPMNVGELTQQLACSQANVSKHLATLANMGVVERRPRGTSVFYAIADPGIYALCDLVCGQLGKHFEHTAQLGRSFIDSAPPPRARAPARKTAARKPAARR